MNAHHHHKTKTGHINTDESCVSSEDDLDNKARSPATSLSPPSTLGGAAKRPRAAGPGGRLMEMEPMPGAGGGLGSTVSPARSDCPSDDPSVTRLHDCLDGGCSRRSGQYIQLGGGAAATSSLRMRPGREQGGGGSGYGSGSESSTSAATIPDVVRTRPADYAAAAGTDYGTISRAISGAKVVQIMENRAGGAPPPPPPPPPPPGASSQRSVTFSPSAKRPADMSAYDTFGRPRRAADADEPRYSAAPGSRRDPPINGRASPPLPPPPPQMDEAYGTLGGSSCSTLGTASSGSSGSVVTVIAGAGGGGPGLGDLATGGSLMRRQVGGKHVAMAPTGGGGGTLPVTKKEGRGRATGLAPK